MNPDLSGLNGPFSPGPSQPTVLGPSRTAWFALARLAGPNHTGLPEAGRVRTRRQALRALGEGAATAEAADSPRLEPNHANISCWWSLTTAMQQPGIPPDSEFEPKRHRDSPPPSPKPVKILRTVEERGRDGVGEEAESDDRSQPVESSNMSQNPRVQRYLVAVEYIGTRFSGSQQQPNCRTVVGVLEVSFVFSPAFMQLWVSLPRPPSYINELSLPLLLNLSGGFSEVHWTARFNTLL